MAEKPAASGVPHGPASHSSRPAVSSHLSALTRQNRSGTPISFIGPPTTPAFHESFGKIAGAVLDPAVHLIRSKPLAGFDFCGRPAQRIFPGQGIQMDKLPAGAG